MGYPDWKLEGGIKRLLTVHQAQIEHLTPRLRVLRNQLDGVRSEQQHYKRGYAWNQTGVPGLKAERRLGGWRQRWLQCERDGSHACCHQHRQRRGIWRVEERRGLAILRPSSFALPSHPSMQLVMTLDSEAGNRSSLEDWVLGLWHQKPCQSLPPPQHHRQLSSATLP